MLGKHNLPGIFSPEFAFSRPEMDPEFNSVVLNPG